VRACVESVVTSKVMATASIFAGVESCVHVAARDAQRGLFENAFFDAHLQLRISREGAKGLCTCCYCRALTGLHSSRS
jgi:hypothetical protein